MRFVCAILFLTAGICLAGPEPAQRMVFDDLDNVPQHPLEPADKIASVLVFYWQDCPVCNGYAPELNRIAASQTNFAFYIVQVDRELTQAAAREHARKFGLHSPVLLDPEHKLVKYARATVTPQVVVIGKSGQVLYRGRIDDGYAAFGRKRATTSKQDLIEVLNALTNGKPVQETETKAIGCLIQ